jgi:hypothetical protein
MALLLDMDAYAFSVMLHTLSCRQARKVLRKLWKME